MSSIATATATASNSHSPSPPADDIQKQLHQQGGNGATPSSSGLDHLVEAATALTQLVRTTSGSKMNNHQEAPNEQSHSTATTSHQISDDEETKSKVSMTSTSTVSTVSTVSSTNAVCVPSVDMTSVVDNALENVVASSGTNAKVLSSLPPVAAPVPITTFPVSAPTQTSAPTASNDNSVGAALNTLQSPSTFKPGENSKEIFPRRLARILADPTISEIITWLPHGRAFVILKTDDLAETVLPKYFPESCSNANSKKGGTKSQTCKYPSFTRKLNRWGFRQITRGPDSGAFHHKYFLREEPDLCLKMVCQRTIKRSKADRSGIGGFKKHSELKPAGSQQILGPYSAALRAQPTMESQRNNSMGNLNNSLNSFNAATFNMNGMQGVVTGAANVQNIQKKSFSPMTESDLDNVTNHNLMKNVINDQSTIVSTRSSCTSPSQALTNINGSVTSHMSPSIANNTQQHGSCNHSPTSQMVRTVSTTSSLQNSASSMNGSLSFPMFQNGSATQIDPRVLLQHNFATNAYNNTANSSFTTTSEAPAPTSTTTANNNITTTTSATSNLPNIPQLAQAHTMPNFITLVDAKSANPNSNNNQQLQQRQNSQLTNLQSQSTVAQNISTTNSNSKFNTPIAPVGINTGGNNTQLNNINMMSGQGNNFGVQQQQRPPQTEAEIRVANAKSMLYKAFLEALG